MTTINFPTIDEATRRRMLAPPAGDEPVRVIIDTDAANEIDDQFALAWALLSQDRLEIEGVCAEPFSFAIHREELQHTQAIIQRGGPRDAREARLVERLGPWLRRLEAAGIPLTEIHHFEPPDVGMERSYEEILRIYDKLNLDAQGLAFRGSPGYLPSPAEPVPSPAAEHIIECARRESDRPLYIAAMGCLTNVASALLMAPEIIRNVVVLWTAGFGSESSRPNDDSFNLIQDLTAARVIFDCGVPLVYLPGFHIGAQLRLSLPEMKAWVQGRGAIGDYLYWLYTHNPIRQQRGVSGHFGRTWIIWDLIDIAWLLNPAWVPTELRPTPVLDDDLVWRQAPGRPPMREAYDIDRDGIFRDLLGKLGNI